MGRKWVSRPLLAIVAASAMALPSLSPVAASAGPPVTPSLPVGPAGPAALPRLAAPGATRPAVTPPPASRRVRPAAPTTAGVGAFNAAVVYNGQPQNFYGDEAHGTLRHAWFTPGGWNFEVLDGAGSPYPGSTTDSVGRYTAVIVYAGGLHVWYQDASTNTLRHAWWNGGGWSFESLDGTAVPGGNGRTSDAVGSYNAVLLYQGQPHVWYFDSDAGALRHAWWTGSGWSFETLDGAGAPGGNGRTGDNAVGQMNAVMLFANTPHVWYFDGNADTLRHAWWTGLAWQFETLDGTGAPGANGRTTHAVGGYNTVVLYGLQPHVWYSDETTGALRHALWTGLAWQFETLDGPGAAGPGRTTSQVGLFNVALLYGGLPQVWYWAPALGSLRHAWWNGTDWAFENLDGRAGPGGSGRTADAVGAYGTVMLYNTQIHLWYDDYGAGTLRHAWWSGLVWQFETLDGNVMSHPAVTGVSPASGPAAGGTLVDISGTGFTGTTGVTFGPAASPRVQVFSDTDLQVQAPPGTATVDVQVVNPVGTSALSSADKYAYLP